MEHMRAQPKKRQEELRGFKTGEGIESYLTEKGPVELRWKEFSPSQEVPSDEAVVSLPGWMGRNAKPLQVLTEQFARFSKTKAFQITTRMDARAEDSVAQEAHAVRDFIRQRGLKHLTLAGHSQGGTKAVDVIVMLQREDPDIEIRGLILFDPVGLYEQEPGELVRNILNDALVKTALVMIKNPSTILPNLRTSSDVIFNVIREAGHQGAGYLEKLRTEIAGMVRANEHYQEVRCPVVLVQGAKDEVLSAERILPNVNEVKTLSERSELLRQTFFPASPHVDMLVPEKLGNHSLPLVRQEQTAKVALYLLERQRRREKTAQKISPTQ